jgi:hypothetical protein
MSEFSIDLGTKTSIIIHLAVQVTVHTSEKC